MMLDSTRSVYEGFPAVNPETLRLLAPSSTSDNLLETPDNGMTRFEEPDCWYDTAVRAHLERLRDRPNEAAATDDLLCTVPSSACSRSSTCDAHI